MKKSIKCADKFILIIYKWHRLYPKYIDLTIWVLIKFDYQSIKLNNQINSTHQ